MKNREFSINPKKEKEKEQQREREVVAGHWLKIGLEQSTRKGDTA